MNIFICHCWQDKTTAELLASDIKPLGNHIALIQDNIPQADLTIVVWTKKAANCENVTRNITALTQQQSTLLPCQFDDTPLPVALRAYPVTDMRNYQQGFPVFVKRLYAKSKTDHFHSDGMANIQEKIAAHEQELVKTLPRGDQSPDSHSLQHMLLATLRSETDLELALRQRHRLQQSLNQLQFARQPTAEKNKPEREFLPTPAVFAELLDMPDNAKIKINFLIQRIVNDTELDALTEQLHYYLQTAGDMLGLLYDITFNTQSDADKQITRHLIDYANTIHKQGQDFEVYMCNICTLAWLIHNTASRLIESGLITLGLFPFDWKKIINTDRFIVNNLTNETRYRLEALLLQLMNIIAMEVKNYQPHFTADNDDYHVYPLSTVTLGLETG